MVRTLLSGTPYLVPFTDPHGVTPGGLLLVANFSIGAGLTGVIFGYLVPMGPTVSCLVETSIWV